MVFLASGRRIDYKLVSFQRWAPRKGPARNFGQSPFATAKTLGTAGVSKGL
jgi:hypothetical protein